MSPYIKTIQRLERLNNSVNGNPAWRVHFTDGESTRTSSDAQVSYALDNPEYRGVPVKFTLTKAGRITGASRPTTVELYGSYCGDCNDHHR
jgi:hypothetical protein